MKYSFFSALLVLSLISNTLIAQTAGPAARETAPSAAVKTAEKKQDYAVPFVNKTLPNGLEVIVLQDSSVPIVTVELAVRNGSFTEPPELHGLSHLYEHMFFKPNYAALIRECDNAGVQRRFSIPQPCADAYSLRTRIGDLSYLRDANKLSSYNGSTREEIVNYFFTATRDNLTSAIRNINDSVRFPAFLESEFEGEKKVVIGEIDRLEANPFGYLDLAMKQKLFYKYPTRKDPQGTRQSISTATIEKMRMIQSRYYVPNNSALIVTGDAKPDEVFRIVEQIMGSWERRAVDPFKEFPLVEHPPLEKSEAHVIERAPDTMADPNGGQNVLINIGWHGPSIGKDDAATYAADVFSYIVTQPDSRFQRNLVDSGLTTGVGLGYYTQRNVGPIQLAVQTNPAKAKAALAAIYKEIAAFTQPTYFTDEELESAKTIIENNDLFEREKGSEYAHTLGFWWSSTGIDYFRTYHSKLRAVTRADINRYIETYILGKNHIAIALVTPEARKQAAITDSDLIGGVK